MSRTIIALAVVGFFAIGGWLFLGGESRDAGPAKEEHHEEEHEGRHVELSAEQIKTAGIGAHAAGPVSIREVLPLYGVIAPNAERTGEVGARFPGTIRAVGKRVGDAVRQGETLATVESNESLQTYAVTAPVSGVVIARNANAGEQTAEKVLFTVSDLSTVWVELPLFPRDAAKVTPGQRARVLSSDAGLEAEGEVVHVAPVGNISSQTRTARIALDNPQLKWAPGIYVSAEIALAEVPVAVAVLSEAVQTLEGETVVFVRTDDGFAPRPVRLGRSDTQHVEVISGLAAGEAYASGNSFILKAELGKGEAEHEH
ncbi:MAG: efflux RND transporter periplasmic adaptor subunit [Rhodospirillaceae bacterium]|nr:efflux RND transporter periplasmic adaptor subunit [Rhodospirillaceae bacterium]